MNTTEPASYLRVVRDWQIQNHWTLTSYAVCLYLLVIFAGKKWMEHRKRYPVQRALIAWNVLLSAFSFYGMCGLGAVMVRVLRKQGFHSLVCNLAHTDPDNMTWAYWGLLFTNSKYLEFGDTVFIVLRKQPLLFLHWYHHVTALMYCTYSFTDQNPPAIPFAVMNLAVHGVMYLYYAVKALGLRLPRGVSMAITTAQIAQMVAAVFVSGYCWTLKWRGRYCGVSDSMLHVSFLLYLSFFLLFCMFFRKSYLGKRERFANETFDSSSTKKVL